jgi:hypothetical protein
MPSHVRHRMTVLGHYADRSRFLDIHMVEAPAKEGEPSRRAFDFNTIIPMPEILGDTEYCDGMIAGVFALTGEVIRQTPGSPHPLTMGAYRGLGLAGREGLRTWMEKHEPQSLALAERSLKAREMTGYLTWWQWAIDHWGTKWNAYHSGITAHRKDRTVIRFDSAWDVPEIILAALSEKWPNLEFRILALDEGKEFAFEAGWKGGVSFGPGLTDTSRSIARRMRRSA